MRQTGSTYQVNGMVYRIRHAEVSDAQQLSQLRQQIDSETENLDREPGEGVIDSAGFEKIIEEDIRLPRNLCLAAESDGKLIGFCRCEGTYLNRFSHKAAFGIGVLRDYWGHAVGRNLLDQAIEWADQHSIRKMTLQVLETNKKAIRLYEQYGFETEGLLKWDRKLSDGEFYHTVIMSRWK